VNLHATNRSPTSALRNRSSRAADDAAPFVALIALAVGAAYLAWRWTATRNGASTPLFHALFAAEASLWVRLALRTHTAWSLPARVAPPLTTLRSTDVVVTAFAEPVDVVRATLIGARAIHHPHETWLVDEGHRAELREVASELNVRYVARSQTTGARTGAVNHVLHTSTADLILVLDADQVPMPDVLHQTAGYFDQPDVAIVQTPLEYSNRDSLLHFEHARHERSHHNEVLNPARDHLDAAVWEGPAAVLRREALVAIGGIPTHGTTGELQATVRLHSKGWKTRYHRETVVQGTAAHNLDAFLAQRGRWARGHLAILVSRDNPLFRRGLSARQRLSHLDHIAEYLAAPFHLAMLTVLVASLLTGQLPLTADALTLVPFLAAWLGLTSLSWVALSRHRVQIRETAMRSAVTLEVNLEALVSVVFGVRRRFTPVARTGVDRGGYDVLKRLQLLALLTIVLEVALALRLLDALIGRPLPGKVGGVALVAMIAAGGSTLVFALRVLGVFVHRRQMRSQFRQGVEFGALAEGRTVKISDLSVGGIGFVSTAMYCTGETVDVRLRLPMADGRIQDIELMVVIRSALPNQTTTRWRLGGQIVGANVATRDALMEFVSVVRPFQLLRSSTNATTSVATSRVNARTPGSY
jgi:cellulose synthase (UDP-forming)